MAVTHRCKEVKSFSFVFVLIQKSRAIIHLRLRFLPFTLEPKLEEKWKKRDWGWGGGGVEKEKYISRAQNVLLAQ